MGIKEIFAKYLRRKGVCPKCKWPMEDITSGYDSYPGKFAEGYHRHCSNPKCNYRKLVIQP